MKFRLMVGLALAAAGLTLIDQLAAATVAPSVLPQHLWLFDETLPGNGTPDEYGGLTLYGAEVNSAPSTTRNPLLVKTDSIISTAGSPLGSAAVPSGTPTGLSFSYEGNKSVLVDWPDADGITYPGSAGPTPRVGLGALQTDLSMDIGTSGAVSFWFNPIRHDDTGAQYLFALRDASPSSARLTVQNSSPFTLVDAHNVSGNVAVASATHEFSYGDAANSMPGTNWYHLVYSWSPGNSISIYENGELLATGFGDVQSFTANRFYVGSYSGGGSQSPGLYDEFAIWDTALTAENVQWLYQNTLSGFIPVPEPSTASFIGVGMIGAALLQRRRRRG